jgi:phosphoserine aminotransferase
MKLVTEWMIRSGGLEYFEEKSKRQSGLLYDFIDNNSSQVICKVDKNYRSNSNVVFSFIKDTDNENFIKLSSENGIIGVNGHRSVGGIRVSLFNSIDDEMFEYFMDFFKQFLIENK